MPNMDKFDQVKYQNKYIKTHYYSPKLSLPAEYREILQTKGKEYGGITAYIKYLIDRDMTQTDAMSTQ